MQPSNQLKGLVESYGNVYANRQQTEELKQIAESIINCVGVHMIENGYVESDVKEFFERSSIGKILDVFEQALDSEEVLKNVNESTGLYETHLRYIPGAMATRMKNESPEIVNRLASRLNEEDLQEFLKGLIDKGRRTLNRGVQKGKEIVSNVVATTKREVPRAVGGAVGSTLGAVAGPVTSVAGGIVGRQAVRDLQNRSGGGGSTATSSGSDKKGGSGRQGPGQGSGRPTPSPTRPSRTGTGLANIPPQEGQYNNPKYGQPGTPSPTPKKEPSTGGGAPIRPRAGDERAPAPKGPASPGGAPIRPRAGDERAPAPSSGGGGGGSTAPRSGGGSTAPAPRSGGGSTGPVRIPVVGSGGGSTSTPTKQSDSSGLTKMQKWAKNFPELAKKVKPGQSGYKEIQDYLAPKTKKESNELDLVVNHLFTEGYADTLDGALSMIEGMSDQFINSILEQVYLESAMVEFLIWNGEAQSIDEANYIISEMDDENIELLAMEAKKVYTVTDLDKKLNNEAWKRYQQGNPQYKYGGLKGV